MTNSAPRVGLVLGAGGLVGHAYISGALAAIEDAIGWDARDADVIVGTSAGSSVAALLRSGFSASTLYELGTTAPPVDFEPLLERFAQPARSFIPLGLPRLPSKRVVRSVLADPGATTWGALAAACLPDGRVPHELVSTSHSDLVGVDWPDKALLINSVGLDNGRRTVFGLREWTDKEPDRARVPQRGRLGRRAIGLARMGPRTPLNLAVAASCAIPGVFTPVEVDGRRFVDGGLHSHTNLDVLAGRDLDLVVVIAPMSTARTVRGPVDLPLRLFFRAQLANEAAAVRASGTPVVTIQPTSTDQMMMGVNAMDPYRRGRVAEVARLSTARRLARTPLRSALAEIDSTRRGRPVRARSSVATRSQQRVATRGGQ